MGGLLCYALVLAVNMPTYHSFGRFDAYHEGESLGAALSLQAGQAPYQDFLFFHGIFQDPGRSVLAFHLFGRSIGAARTLESICKILTWLALALFLKSLWPSRPSRAFISLSVLALFQVGFIFNLFFENFIARPSPETAVALFAKTQPYLKPFELLIVTPRDLIPMVYSLVLISFWREARRPIRRRGLLLFLAFCFSFLPFLGLVYSVDRGYCLLAIFLAASLGFAAMGIKIKKRAAFVGASVLGLLCGAGLLGWLIHWNFADFFNYVFWILPRTKELSDKNGPYPITDPSFLAVALLMAALLFREVREMTGVLSRDGNLYLYFQRRFPQGLLIFWSLLCFRGAFVRPDWEHVIYGLDFFWILILFRLFEWKDRWMASGRQRFDWKIPGLCFLLAGLSFVHFARWDGARQNFPLKVPDDNFMTDDQKAVAAYFNQRLGPKESFFTLTSEAGWYYFLDRVCPTPFPYIWTAAPDLYQRQVVEDLESQKIRLVIYRDADWSYRIDGIPNDEKFPIISAYLRKAFRPLKTLGGCEIWTRKKEVKAE